MRAFSLSLGQIARGVARIAAFALFCIVYRVVIGVGTLEPGGLRPTWWTMVQASVLTAVVSPSALWFFFAFQHLRRYAGGLLTREGRTGLVVVGVISLGASLAVARALPARERLDRENAAALVGSALLLWLGGRTLRNAEALEGPRATGGWVTSGARASSYDRMRERSYRETEDS